MVIAYGFTDVELIDLQAVYFVSFDRHVDSQCASGKDLKASRRVALSAEAATAGLSKWVSDDCLES
jgi:hypothetical protein